MATINEDKGSWKAQGILRRDFRHTHSGPEVDKRGRKKKNTQRWCRGKEGKEHAKVHRPHPTLGKYGCHVDVCNQCGKELKTYWKGFESFLSRVGANANIWCPVCREQS